MEICVYRRGNVTYILIAAKRIGHVTGRVLVKFLVVTEDDDRNIDGTKNRQLVSLLEQTTFALKECATCRTVSIIPTG